LVVVNATMTQPAMFLWHPPAGPAVLTTELSLPARFAGLQRVQREVGAIFAVCLVLAGSCAGLVPMLSPAWATASPDPAGGAEPLVLATLNLLAILGLAEAADFEAVEEGVIMAGPREGFRAGIPMGTDAQKRGTSLRASE